MLIDRYADRPLTLIDRFAVRWIICTIICVLFPFVGAGATSYAALQDSTYGAAQIRTAANFNLKFDRVTLQFGEEFRFNLAPAQEFQLANTTVGLNVSIIKGYFSAHAAYILRVRTNKFGTTTDANKLLRHRVYFGLTEQVKLGVQQQWVLSLKERAVLTSRTDAPNAFEKQANAWEMRYRFQVQYKALSKPLTPYIWTELAHTCNATEFQKYYHDNRNYVSAVRVATGVKWRINSLHSLHFYLRYDWLQDYEIDANQEGTNVKSAYHMQKHQGLFGIAYIFDWKK